MPLLDRLDRAVERVALWCVYAGCVAVVGILVLLAGSSIKRYVLGTPIPVTEELAALFFVAVSFCSMPYGFCARRQIRVLVLWRRLPERLSAWAAVAGDLVAIAILVVLIQSLWAFTQFSLEVGAVSEVADIPLWPWMALMTAMLGLLGLALVTRIAVHIRDARAGRPVALVEGSSVD